MECDLLPAQLVVFQMGNLTYGPHLDASLIPKAKMLCL
jgi:hypothetical protein